MKYRVKSYKNIEARDIIKKMLIALRDKKEKKSSICELRAIIQYIESHEIIFNHVDNLKEYLELFEEKSDMYTQDEWEWLLKYLMMIISSYLQNPYVEEWDDFDLKQLLDKQEI